MSKEAIGPEIAAPIDVPAPPPEQAPVQPVSTPGAHRPARDRPTTTVHRLPTT